MLSLSVQEKFSKDTKYIVIEVLETFLLKIHGYKGHKSEAIK